MNNSHRQLLFVKILFLLVNTSLSQIPFLTANLSSKNLSIAQLCKNGKVNLRMLSFCWYSVESTSIAFRDGYTIERDAIARAASSIHAYRKSQITYEVFEANTNKGLIEFV